MMKIALGVSLLLNLVLAYFVANKKTEVVERERLIIETHAAPVNVTEAKNSPPEANKAPARKEDSPPPMYLPLESQEFQEAGEQMESDRVSFLTEKLGMTEEKLAQHNKIRNEFLKETTKFWQKNPMGELSFKERRLMLEKEEKFHARLEKIYGKKNWEKYQKYREQYNMKGFKQQSEENRPFIFMGL